MSTFDSGSGSGSGFGPRPGFGGSEGPEDSAGPDGGRRRRKRLYGSVRLPEPLPTGELTARQPREVPPPVIHPGLALQVLNLRTLRRPPG
ncbi:hypothetical protein [Phaeacidiphilus oryzae]|uniref:hypothetical protein n=1 Tax=Phaeacidiphilus oryzae TaxID=348818 RepID=UPI000559C1D5|nr:hypothetical protein [Phaeacidiphilus oryzae]